MSATTSRAAEQPGRVVAEQVDVVEAVGVVEHRPVGADDTERERVDVQHGARVAARQHDGGPLGELAAARALASA